MIDTLVGSHVTANLWAKQSEIEPQALKQIENVAALPCVRHVAVMPDVHYGKGMTVGSVIAMREACSPAAVGVDIGCGMLAVKTSLYASDLDGKLPALRSAIEAEVPVGFNAHDSGNQLQGRFNLQEVMNLQIGINSLFGSFKDLDPYVQTLSQRALNQIGTLGGGNHFIELCLDDDDCATCHGNGFAGQKREPHVWIMLHSGSRNIGKTLAEIHISKARSLAHNAELPDPDLAVFLAGTPEMAAYRHDLYWAQEYARLNRLVTLDLIKQAIEAQFGKTKIEYEMPISCHHNYVSEETHFGEKLFVTRKGAISAQPGQFGIIPGSMGTASFIVRGLGNASALNSASHGAGRRMSRGAAKRKFSLADLALQTTGIECRKDAGVLDEIPEAYKDIHNVMEAQRDLVEVVTELHGVLCVKG